MITWESIGVNNITIHNYLHSKCPIKTIVYFRHDSKIKKHITIVFINESAARDYLNRQKIDNLPIKVFNHKGE